MAKGRICIGAALAIASLAGALPGAAAGATNKPSLEVATLKGPSLGRAGKTVACPQGRTALGGGFIAGDPTTNPAFLEQTTPLPSSGDPGQTFTGVVPRKWNSYVQPGGSTTFKGKAIAVCEARKDVRLVVSGIYTIAPDNPSVINVVEAQIACDADESAVSGGIIGAGPYGGPSGIYVNGSGPLDETGITLNTNDGDRPAQWYVSASNLADHASYFRVVAVCVRHSSAEIRETTFQLAADQFQAKAKVDCPSGEFALGGGLVESGPPVAGLFSEDGPLDATGSVGQTRTGDRPRQWYVDYVGQTAAGRTLRIFAVCE